MTNIQRRRIEEYLKILKAEPKLYRTAEHLLSDDSTEFEQAVYTAVFCPALLEFVEWVLDEAQAREIRRLYFLARDGYPMYLAAKALCETEKRSPECRYLYGSRYAWRMPLFSIEGEASLDMICRGGIDVTFEKIMNRGGLTGKEACEVAEELGMTERFREVLSYNEVMRLKQPLKESGLFLPYVYAHSKECFKEISAYFKQEGLIEDVSYALVDSGWTGSLQMTLQRLLASAGCSKVPEGFYFGLYELPKEADKTRYHGYYFTPKSGIKRKVYFSNCLYEAVYSAPHGMTVAYEDTEAGFGPVFYKEKSLNASKMEQYALWLELFMKEYTAQTAIASNEKRSKRKRAKTVYRLFRKMMGKPLKEEAECFGTLLFSDDVTEEYTQEVAVELTTDELKALRVFHRIMIMTGMKKGVLHDSAWQEGSVVRNGIRTGRNLRHVTLYKYMVYLRKAIRK